MATSAGLSHAEKPRALSTAIVSPGSETLKEAADAKNGASTVLAPTARKDTLVMPDVWLVATAPVCAGTISVTPATLAGAAALRCPDFDSRRPRGQEPAVRGSQGGAAAPEALRRPPGAAGGPFACPSNASHGWTHQPGSRSTQLCRRPASDLTNPPRCVSGGVLVVRTWCCCCPSRWRCRTAATSPGPRCRRRWPGLLRWGCWRARACWTGWWASACRRTGPPSP